MGPPFKKGCAKLLKLFNYLQLWNMKNITAIIFDLGGVILNINYQNTISEFEKLGIKNSNTLYSKKMQVSLFNQLEIGKISAKKFLLEIQKKTTQSSVIKIKNAWNSMLLDLPEERIKLIKLLKRKYKLFLLSNTNSIHINKLKNNLGIKKYTQFLNLFDKVYYSHKIKARKPNKESFQLILKQQKLHPNNVLFIDDSIQHIQGAKKLGIKTHHLKDQEITILFPDIAL